MRASDFSTGIKLTVFTDRAGANELNHDATNPRKIVQAGLSFSEVARALKLSNSTVGKYVSLARVAGVDLDLAQTWKNPELEVRPHGNCQGSCRKVSINQAAFW